MDANQIPRKIDPLELARIISPNTYFYDKQREIIYSVWNNKETCVPAGNMLGKDFVAGFIIPAFFLTRYPCRIVTTSVRDDHLDILWGEVNRCIQDSPIALRREDGGPLIINDREITRWEKSKGEKSPLCYIKGIVTQKGEGLSGHHIANTGDGIPRTLFAGDEASGLDEVCYRMVTAWANSILTIGNCWKCENWFRYSVEGRPGTKDKGGDIPRDPDDLSKGYDRKIIHITAEDSPNVRLAKAEIAAGLEPSGRVIVPGVKSWQEFQSNLRMWDEERICVGLYAKWYKGAQLYLFPEDWLTIAEDNADLIQNKLGRQAKGIGVDCAEGGDNTSLCAVDEDGIIDLESKKTPDTSEIPDMVLKFMRKWRCPPERVLFDRGGGGYQHVNAIKKLGFPVRSIAFGEASGGGDSGQKWKYFHTRKERQFEAEEKTIYKNRRAELYGVLRDLLNPAYETGFSIPRRFVAIRDQLSPIPLWWEDGKLVLPPKQAKPDSKEDNKVTLIKLIGHSPDEADSLCLAVYAMTHKMQKTVLGSMV